MRHYHITGPIHEDIMANVPMLALGKVFSGMAKPMLCVFSRSFCVWRIEAGDRQVPVSRDRSRTSRSLWESWRGLLDHIPGCDCSL